MSTIQPKPFPFPELLDLTEEELLAELEDIRHFQREQAESTVRGLVESRIALRLRMVDSLRLPKGAKA